MKLLLRDLNPGPCPPHSTSTYTCGVTIDQPCFILQFCFCLFILFQKIVIKLLSNFGHIAHRGDCLTMKIAKRKTGVRVRSSAKSKHQVPCALSSCRQVRNIRLNCVNIEWYIRIRTTIIPSSAKSKHQVP